MTQEQLEKHRRWYVKFPRDAYALGPIKFEEPVDESEPRKWAMWFDQLKQLPEGFQCWPVREDE